MILGPFTQDDMNIQDEDSEGYTTDDESDPPAGTIAPLPRCVVSLPKALEPTDLEPVASTSTLPAPPPAQLERKCFE